MAHMHAGHRARLKQRFEKEDLDHFQPHEVLELLLFYAIPQRDVNPLAHALIDRFGSLGGVLSADPNALMQVDGIGEKTAKWLNSLNSAVNHYKTLRLDDRPKLSTLSSISEYCVEMLANEPEGQFWLYNLNMAGYLIHSAQLEDLAALGEQATIRRITDLSIRYHAQCFVLVQNRRATNMRMHPRDVEFTKRVNATLLSIKIPMIDHLFICGQKVESMREAGILYPDDTFSVSEEATSQLIEHWLD